MSIATNKKRIVRAPNFIEAFFPIIFMMFSLFLGRVIFNINMSVLLIISTIVTAIISYFLGKNWDDIMQGIVNKTTTGIGACYLLIVVGAMIASMIASGTVPMLIYFGMQIISPKWLILTSFLLCCLVSVITGTSWGSVATIGVAIMGVAIVFDANKAAVAGAVIGGSWFGDKLSPLSDTTNLTAAATDTELFTHVKTMVRSTIPSAIIAIVVYAIIGFFIKNQNIEPHGLLDLMSEQLSIIYNWNILLLTPIVLVLLFSILKYPAIPTMIIATVVSIILAIIFQDFSLEQILVMIYSGFNIEAAVPASMEVIPEVASLLNIGGMYSMLGTILLILSAFAFAGTLDTAGCLNSILSLALKVIDSNRKLYFVTISSCLCICIITNNYVSSVVLGEMYQDIYKRRGLHQANLARMLEDCGTCIIPMVPWSASGAYVVAILGITQMEFIPWAVFCLVSPIVSIFIAMTGIGILHLSENRKG